MSIYEAVIHHLLFDRLKNDPKVKSLTGYKTKKQISIPPAKQQLLEKALKHDGREIVPCYEDVAHTDISKVRFEDKAACAAELGFITTDLQAELATLYSDRNAIHLHAELRKAIKFELTRSKLAYRRMQPFRAQVVAEMKRRGLL